MHFRFAWSMFHEKEMYLCLSRALIFFQKPHMHITLIYVFFLGRHMGDSEKYVFENRNACLRHLKYAPGTGTYPCAAGRGSSG